tara:strand:- start:183 stop:839 length:657 start_codon:yes stop_codon:yes gene_type:complete
VSAVSSARARKGKGDGETRAKILAASEELFAELGYSGTSISKIAKKAGVLSGSIYFCFPSKDDIFATLITEGSDAWREYMQRDDRQESELPTDLKGLKDDLFQILYSLRERPNFVRLMFAAVVEAKTDNKTIRHALRVLRRSSIRDLESDLMAVYPDLPEKAVNDIAKRYARLLIVMCDGVFMQSSIEGSSPELKELCQLMAETVVAGIEREVLALSQ